MMGKKGKISYDSFKDVPNKNKIIVRKIFSSLQATPKFCQTT